MIDATFWVAVSFTIFVALLIYFKIPNKVISILENSITNIKNQVNDAEKLKAEAKQFLNEHEQKLSSSKVEVKKMIDKANDESEKNLIKINANFHSMMENKKKSSEQRIAQMKGQAIKDVKNASIKIAIQSVERLLRNSLDKSKLDKIYIESIEETKLALKKKSS